MCFVAKSFRKKNFRIFHAKATNSAKDHFHSEVVCRREVEDQSCFPTLGGLPSTVGCIPIKSTPGRFGVTKNPPGVKRALLGLECTQEEGQRPCSGAAVPPEVDAQRDLYRGGDAPHTGGGQVAMRCLCTADGAADNLRRLHGQSERGRERFVGQGWWRSGGRQRMSSSLVAATFSSFILTSSMRSTALKAWMACATHPVGRGDET